MVLAGAVVSLCDVAPAPTLASVIQFAPSVLRSMRKPDSLSLLSLHVRSTRLADAAAAERSLGAAGLVTVAQVGRERTYHLERDRLHAITVEWLRWFDASAPRPR